jgi:hypothetical protein
LGKPFLFWWKMEVSCIFSLLTNPMNIGNIMEYIYIHIYIYIYTYTTNNLIFGCVKTWKSPANADALKLVFYDSINRWVFFSINFSDKVIFWNTGLLSTVVFLNDKHVNTS